MNIIVSVYLVLLANGTEDYTDIGYPLRFFFYLDSTEFLKLHCLVLCFSFKKRTGKTKKMCGTSFYSTEGKLLTLTDSADDGARNSRFGRWGPCKALRE